MKVLYLECNAEEMRANRTLIDAFVDISHVIVDAFNAPISDSFEQTLRKTEGTDQDEDDQESEE